MVNRTKNGDSQSHTPKFDPNRINANTKNDQLPLPSKTATETPTTPPNGEAVGVVAQPLLNTEHIRPKNGPETWRGPYIAQAKYQVQ